MRTFSIQIKKEYKNVEYVCQVEVQTNEEEILYIEILDAVPMPETNDVWDWLNENITDEDCKNVL